MDMLGELVDEIAVRVVRHGLDQLLQTREAGNVHHGPIH